VLGWRHPREIRGKKGENMNDYWEYPEACAACQRCDNGDLNEPVTVLEANTHFCSYCFEEFEWEKEKGRISEMKDFIKAVRQGLEFKIKT
jgi:hypothetical protein